MRDPFTAGGTVAAIFDKQKDAEAAARRLRDAGFADVRISERSGSTAEEHVDESAGRTEIDFAQTLRAAGFDDEAARTMTRAVASGRVLLTVGAGDRNAEAQAVLRGERVTIPPLKPVDPAPAADAGPVADPVLAAPAAPAAGQNMHEGDRVIPIREERLEVEKEPTTSEARIRRETVTEQKTITVPVRREELVVEREGEAPLHIPVADEEQAKGTSDA